MKGNRESNILYPYVNLKIIKQIRGKKEHIGKENMSRRGNIDMSRE